MRRLFFNITQDEFGTWTISGNDVAFLCLRNETSKNRPIQNLCNNPREVLEIFNKNKNDQEIMFRSTKLLILHFRQKNKTEIYF